MPYSNYSADSLFYSGGFRWTPRADSHFSPFAQLMFGGRKVTMEILNWELRKQLLDEWNDGNGTLGHILSGVITLRKLRKMGPVSLPGVALIG